MFHRLREPFGKAGLIVAAVALIAALGGGAYAASNSGDGSATVSAKKKNKKGKAKGLTVAQVRKIAKQEARKLANSNPGPAGPQGLAGAAGPKGDNGANGQDGQNGSNGSNGSNGTSANATAYTGPECEEASGESGLKVTSAGPDAYVCNGENGEEGSPWTAGGTLPSGETLTGSWGFSGFNDASQAVDISVPISFPIPLAAALVDPDGGGPLPLPVHHTGSANFAANCTGTAIAPTAAQGHLCVYVRGLGMTNAAFVPGGPLQPVPISRASNTSLSAGADVSGAMLNFNVTAAGNASGTGTFAVTAP
jgi:hypothetical protein